jgi:hypothetical protein
MKHILSLAMLSLAILSLTSCTEHTIQRETAMRTAMPQFMIPRMVTAGDFTIQVFERIHDKNGPAIVYIEGDGNSPQNPIGLRLAAQDSAENVIVITRPCQYGGTFKGGDCPKRFTGSYRYSEPVIQAYNNILNNIKSTHDLSGFHLVGYEGGAAIATIVAAGRMDIASIRTVSGILDTQIIGGDGTLPMLDGSLNPRNFAQSIVTIPQRHFVGGKDTVVTDLPARSYLNEVKNAPCVNITMIDNATNNQNWVEQWGELLKQPVRCK